MPGRVAAMAADVLNRNAGTRNGYSTRARKDLGALRLRVPPMRLFLRDLAGFKRT